jgi:hypothetical protein
MNRLKHIIYNMISSLVEIGFRIKIYYCSKKHYKERIEQQRKPKLLFGTTPVINNKYWSNALKKDGWDSVTLMKNYYSINSSEDFDLYFEDILKKSSFRFKYFCSDYIVLSFILKNFDIVHIPFNGFLFNNKWIKKNEIQLLKKYGCKIIVLPFGGDFYQYSKIPNLSWRHVLQVNYPNLAQEEAIIEKNIKKQTLNADAIITGWATEGLGRWDVLPYNILCIDIDKFCYPSRDFINDGKIGVVRIVHSPNHRYIKGTEFLIEAVSNLQNKGLLLELILIENKTNEEVLNVLNTKADILVEQLVMGYGLSAIEGMSAGIPVLTNLDDEHYTRVFRRYSYLNECPILSVTPENIEEKIKILVLNPKLRRKLGTASREYVKKYHSYESAKYMFNRVYEKIWFNKDVDLMNMYHPLHPDSYNNKSPKIVHPLIENKIPNKLLEKLNR